MLSPGDSMPKSMRSSSNLRDPLLDISPAPESCAPEKVLDCIDRAVRSQAVAELPAGFSDGVLARIDRDSRKGLMRKPKLIFRIAASDWLMASVVAGTATSLWFALMWSNSSGLGRSVLGLVDKSPGAYWLQGRLVDLQSLAFDLLSFTLDSATLLTSLGSGAIALVLFAILIRMNRPSSEARLRF